MVRTAEPLPSWDELVAIFADHGIDHIGVAPAAVLTRARHELYRRSKLGFDAGMGFTYRNPDRSTDPSRSVEGARSIIVAAIGYGSEEFPPTPEHSGRIARYAWRDYYEPLRLSLRIIAKRLRRAGERAVAFADDNSVVDREVAYLAGLGWFGKNANILVNGIGSYVVLGSIITTATYPPATPVSDGCGACRRCIDECPTAAIVEPGVVDANRCLAWLIQQPGAFPIEFREALGDRFYGCDDCQESCPPTVRLGHKGRVDLDRLSPDGNTIEVGPFADLEFVLTAPDDELLAAFGQWYLAGRDPRWWRRNALIIIGNTSRPDDAVAAEFLERYANGADVVLAEHARWAQQKIATRSSGGGAAVESPSPSLSPSPSRSRSRTPSASALAGETGTGRHT